jgi:hypothetical protein
MNTAHVRIVSSSVIFFHTIRRPASRVVKRYSWGERRGRKFGIFARLVSISASIAGSRIARITLVSPDVCFVSSLPVRACVIIFVATLERRIRGGARWVVDIIPVLRNYFLLLILLALLPSSAMTLRSAHVEVIGVVIGCPISQGCSLNRGRYRCCCWLYFFVGRACTKRWCYFVQNFGLWLRLLRPFDGLKTLGGFSTREYCCLTNGLLTGLS